jgi:hypothetical protein
MINTHKQTHSATTNTTHCPAHCRTLQHTLPHCCTLPHCMPHTAAHCRPAAHSCAHYRTLLHAKQKLMQAPIADKFFSDFVRCLGTLPTAMSRWLHSNYHKYYYVCEATLCYFWRLIIHITHRLAAREHLSLRLSVAFSAIDHPPLGHLLLLIAQ